MVSRIKCRSDATYLRAVVLRRRLARLQPQ